MCPRAGRMMCRPGGVDSIRQLPRRHIHVILLNSGPPDPIYASGIAIAGNTVGTAPSITRSMSGHPTETEQGTVSMRTLILTRALPFVLVCGALLLAPHPAAHAQPSGTAEAQLVQPNRYGLPDFSDLVEAVGPAVVNINVVRQQSRASHPPFDDPMFELLRRFGMPMPEFHGHGREPRISRGIGSGFIVSDDGYILTNAHVVGDHGADTEVTVRLLDRREFTAEVIGSDPRTDIAVLKIDAADLPTVTFGDAEETRVGEWVVAVGSPFGFDSTVTAGIVSAKARRLPSENYVPFLQTDVAINPGNSGGPLFNLAGEVVGINAQIYSRSGGFMGISFAIPIDVALGVKEQLVEYGRVQRGKLGVTIQAMDADLARNFGLDEATGALVASVEPDSAAATAGLQSGDVVLSVNDTVVDESADLPRLIGEQRPGTEIELEIWRDGERHHIEATLDEMESPENIAEAAASEPAHGEDLGARLGLTARPLESREAAHIGAPGGLAVESVTGTAARAGLRRGDIILAINNRAITDVAQFREHIQNAGNRFALLVQRGDSRIFIPLTLD